MARGGNALDQAVLLATLLRDAGLDARIQRGRLSEADATTQLRDIEGCLLAHAATVRQTESGHRVAAHAAADLDQPLAVAVGDQRERVDLDLTR